MPRLNQARVVIVGDPSNCKELTRILTHVGHPFRAAQTAGECLRIMGDELPDVLLIHCPPAESAGLELCSKLRENPYSAGAAVILISSAFSRSAERVAGLEAGADACLTEPLESAELLAQVDCLARLRRVEMRSEE